MPVLTSSFRAEFTLEVFMVLWPTQGAKSPKTAPRDSIRTEVDAMTRWFYGFFFFFPRPLAEGNG
jgi:hypothetical protein